MEQGFLLAIASCTSVGAYLVGRRWSQLSGRRLATGVLKTLELAGMCIVFFAVNVAVGLAVILAVRTITTGFLSAYLLDDIALLGLSVLQGLVFGCSRRSPTQFPSSD